MLFTPYPAVAFAARPARALGRVLGTVALGGAALLSCIVPVAAAQDLNAIAYNWLHDELQRHGPQNGPSLRMDVELGRLDPRLQLSACGHVQPYLPAGSRLWGRTRLGLRCVDGPRAWNVFLPVTIRAYGPAWVMVRNANMGDVLDSSYATIGEVDWAAETSPIIEHETGWVGLTAARALVPGQALRQSLVRPGQIFKSGSVVRVLSRGAGFSITSSGKALTGGTPGQEVRVRLENGRIVTGTATETGEVILGH